jgi:hypothetical protein
MIVKAVNGKFVVWNGWNSTPLSKEFDTIKEAEEEMRLIELRDTEPMEKLLWEQQKLKAKLGIK